MPRPIAAIVLAAGPSVRFGSVNKLLCQWRETPVVTRVVDVMVGAFVSPVIVVVGHQADKISAVLEGRPVTFVENENDDEGIASSIRAGLAAVPKEIEGALIVPADMPYIRKSQINRIVAAFSPTAGHHICMPVFESAPGQPILWGRRYFERLKVLQGDEGPQTLVEEFAEDIQTVEMEDDSTLVDLDAQIVLAKTATS